MQNNIITVFTPTYNRANLLPKLYDSLQRQTSKDFIWLIVDDGSTDNTEKLIDKWKKESTFEITYIKQKNGGKMRAHNTGVKNCETELFINVDSDDFITDHTVEKIINNWNSLTNKKDVSGIIAYKADFDKKLLSSVFPELKFSTLTNIYDKGFKGDTTLVYRSDILKATLFPEINGEKFITENYIYAQIDLKYTMLVLPEILTMCEYQHDGYTNNSIKLMKNNPKGYILYYNMKIKIDKSIWRKIKYSTIMVSIMFLGGIKNKMQKADNKCLFLATYFMGYILYLKRKKHAR